MATEVPTLILGREFRKMTKLLDRNLVKMTWDILDFLLRALMKWWEVTP